jgi:predicted nucleotide-binding protein
MKHREELIALADRLESILVQNTHDIDNKNWGTYDILIEEYNKIRDEFQKHSDELPWLQELPIIETVPSGERGGSFAGGPSITGVGTTAERAKYSEITTKLRPQLIRIQKSLSEKEKSISETVTQKANEIPRIFIVHGHDLATARRVKEFISDDLKMEPIILMDEVSLGRTIPEKFEQYANESDFAIIIMTPDDELTYSDRKAVIYRSRQNVVLELGYFWAKFDRSKFAVLKKGNIEAPSDIQGVVYLPFKDDVEEVFYKLQKEILAAFKYI